MHCATTTIQHDVEIDGFSIKLYFLSRDWTVLAAIALGILALATGLAWLVRGADVAVPAALPPTVQLERLMQSAKPETDALFALLPQVGEALPADFEQRIAATSFGPDTKLVAGAFAASLRDFRDEPNARLLILAHQPQPLLRANEAVAELLARHGHLERAREYFLRELSFFPSDAARSRWIATLAARRAFELLGEAARDPSFAPYFSSSLRLTLAVHEGRWFEAVCALAEVERETLRPIPLIAVLAAGLAWFLIAVQAGQPGAWFCFRTVAPVLAVGTGLLASWASHFVVVWQEQVLGLRQTGEFLPDFFFELGNVAVREELLKLVFLLPFLPWLLRRGNALETLIVSGCVGLGFAIEGNLQSYRHVGPENAFGRLLTANFFHLAASGLLGCAFVELLKGGRGSGVRFLAALTGIIFAHGIYNAFVSVPGLRLLTLVSMASFLVLSLVFFHQLRCWRDRATDQLYLSATLIFSLSLLSGTMLVCAASQLGFSEAVRALAANALGLLLVVAVFFRRLGRGLTAYDPSDVPEAIP
jgi:hypothetical protein